MHKKNSKYRVSTRMSVSCVLRARAVPLVILGLLVSLYLSHHHIEVKSNLQIGASICSFDEVFDCDSVARSSYSELFSVTVAYLGVFFYSAILLLIFLTKNSNEDKIRNVNSVLFLAFTPSLLLTLYLAYGSYVDLGKVCLFCSLLYVINIAIFALFLFFKSRRGSLREGLRYLLGEFFCSLSGMFFVIGIVGLLLIISFFPKVYEHHFLIPRYLEVYDKSVIQELVSQWKEAGAEIDEEAALKLPGAIIREPLGEYTSSGEILTLVEFADYECPFCKKVAPVLEKLYQNHKEKLRFVVLNFPLDNSCNRSIESTFHKNSCRIARGVLCASLDYKMSSIDIHHRVLEEKLQGQADFTKLMADSGIDETKCKNSDLALKEQIEFALEANIHSTPSIFISGKRIKFNSFPQVEAVLEAIISGN